MQTGINWKAVRAEMDSAEWSPVDRFTEERRVYLGRVMSLFPSGKYYEPWACSNLTPCLACRGEGRRPNPRYRRKQYERLYRITNRLRRQAVERFGFYSEGRWPSGLLAKLKRLDARIARSDSMFSCRTCGGLGSREAWLDSVYSDALEAEAEAHDLSVACGEGDPTDVFACECRDITRDDDDDDEENEDD